MYSSKPSIVYGFHGMDRDAAIKILNQESDFIHSSNDYDWLGNGVYFWENNLERAKQYAEEDRKRRNTKIKEPFVLGAVIELGNCLDLLDQKGLDFIKECHQLLVEDLKAENKPIPVNKKIGKNDFDFKNRQLDCAVIRYACAVAEEQGQPFDSVRAAFIEGDQLYDGAKVFSKNHIQLAIRNMDCIKGIFLPREKARKITT
jgi:hypothetical protein